MKYTKYDNDKKVYIIGKNHTSESELDAEWKEDIGIPTSELDIDTTMAHLKQVKKNENFYWEMEFVVIHNNKEYRIIFAIYSHYKMTYSVRDFDNSSMSLCNEIDIKTPYLITDKDLDVWQKTKQQITENLGLSLGTWVDVNIF